MRRLIYLNSCFFGMPSPFAVLAEPARRQILDLLRERPRLAGEITAHLGLSQPGTSKHLRVLREAGLVAVRPEAQRRGTSCGRSLWPR